LKIERIVNKSRSLEARAIERQRSVTEAIQKAKQKVIDMMPLFSTAKI
jgi:hypothetical protein